MNEHATWTMGPPAMSAYRLPLASSHRPDEASQEVVEGRLLEQRNHLKTGYRSKGRCQWQSTR